MIAAVMLGAGLPSALRAGRLAEWRRDWRRASDVLARPGDRRPLAGGIADLASVLRQALRDGVSMRAASTRDIEWIRRGAHAMNAAAALASQVEAYLHLAPVSSNGIRNLRTRIDSASAGEMRFPVTINHSEPDNAWICSPYTAYVRYAVEETARLPRQSLAMPLALLCRAVGALLKRARIDDAVAVNNWLVSTNCWPDEGADRAAELVHECVSRWPGHAVWFRSLNRRYTRGWMDALERAGCELIPSRQVWLYDDLRQRRAQRESASRPEAA